MPVRHRATDHQRLEFEHLVPCLALPIQKLESASLKGANVSPVWTLVLRDRPRVESPRVSSDEWESKAERGRHRLRAGAHFEQRTVRLLATVINKRKHVTRWQCSGDEPKLPEVGARSASRKPG